MTFIDWISVAAAVDHCKREYKDIVFSGVYGVPRGGLCLAVMLSHNMDIPLLAEPNDTCLIVDDVYETGETLASYRHKYPGAEFFTMASKMPFDYGVSFRQCPADEWLVFPWEDKVKAQFDQDSYYASRQRNL